MMVRIRSPRRLRTLGELATIAHFVPVLVAFLVAGTLLLILQFLSRNTEFMASSRVDARLVGDSSAAALMFRDQKAAQEALALLAQVPTVTFAELRLPEGEQLASWQHSPHAQPLPWFELPVDDREILEPVRVEGHVVGEVRLLVTPRPLVLNLITYFLTLLLVSAISVTATWPLIQRMRRNLLRLEQDLQRQAQTDAVTGLPNRNAFHQHLSDALARRAPGARVSMLLVDLDNFKIVNDTLGHQRGDELLQGIGQRLQQLLPASNPVCRIGGDEFAVLLPQTRGEEAEHTAQRIVELLNEPIHVGDTDIYASASIGVCHAPQHGDDPSALAVNADIAMRQAKSRGKNAWLCFEPAMAEKNLRRTQLLGDLRTAVDEGRFELLYQPQISIASHRIVGVEALVRWRHPRIGLINPGEFIDVAEDSGLIVQIGHSVMAAAFQQAENWTRRGFGHLRVGVNVSPKQLQSRDFADSVLKLLQETHVRPEQLELEITEGMLLDAAECLEDLRNMGIGLAVDDFGTGYSSLSYLHKLPVNKLKIDQSFVQRIPGDGEAVTAAIIDMARTFGLKVIAEGVETAQQLLFLQRAGCHEAQGWLFSKAVTAAEVEALVVHEVEHELFPPQAP